MAKVSYPEIDKLFETMDRKTANKLNGTHPPKRKPVAKKKTTTKRKTTAKKKK